jgi:hypothetical protein
MPTLDQPGLRLGQCHWREHGAEGRSGALSRVVSRTAAAGAADEEAWYARRTVRFWV